MTNPAPHETHRSGPLAGLPIDGPACRASTTCGVCGGTKSVGTWVCWPCFAPIKARVA